MLRQPLSGLLLRGLYIAVMDHDMDAPTALKFMALYITVTQA